MKSSPLERTFDSEFFNNMVTISHLVEKAVNEQPLLSYCIEQDIVSFGNVAEQLEKSIAKELGKPVQRSAIVMALRRYAEKSQEKAKVPRFDFRSEITLTNHLCDIAVRKGSGLFGKLPAIRETVDRSKGEMLNIIHGIHESVIVTNMRHIPELKRILKDSIIHVQDHLVAVSLRFSEKFLYTPGVIATCLRLLLWHGINIFEIVSTFTELTFILHENDALKAYKALQELVSV